VILKYQITNIRLGAYSVYKIWSNFAHSFNKLHHFNAPVKIF
jgi:hypothetical protein